MCIIFLKNPSNETLYLNILRQLVSGDYFCYTWCQGVKVSPFDVGLIQIPREQMSFSNRVLEEIGKVGNVEST